MPNILEHAQSSRALRDIKCALRDVGCNSCEVEDLYDVASAIKKHLSANPPAVVNASLTAGPGIKVTPVDRRGYKISANDEALLSADVCDTLPKGTSVNKALHTIVNRMIPAVYKKAVRTPHVYDIEVFKAPYDGLDFYTNKAFGRNGRKSGLIPDSWYVKIITTSALEPIYINLGPAMEDMKREILCECQHMVAGMIADALTEYDHTRNIKKPDTPTPKPSTPLIPLVPSEPTDCGCGCMDDMSDFNWDFSTEDICPCPNPKQDDDINWEDIFKCEPDCNCSPKEPEKPKEDDKCCGHHCKHTLTLSNPRTPCDICDPSITKGSVQYDVDICNIPSLDYD